MSLRGRVERPSYSRASGRFDLGHEVLAAVASQFISMECFQPHVSLHTYLICNHHQDLVRQILKHCFPRYNFSIGTITEVSLPTFVSGTLKQAAEASC